MSMIACFRLSSDREIKDLLESPKRILKLLHDQELSETPGFLARLFGATKKIDSWEPENPFNEEDEIDLDKAWHAIHFLLCDDPWEGDGPLSFIVNGGKVIGDVDVGYGPARAFSQKDTCEINSELNKVSLKDLREKFDFEKLEKADIYPTIWDRKDNEDIDYVIEYFEILKSFVNNACKNNYSIITYIS